MNMEHYCKVTSSHSLDTLEYEIAHNCLQHKGATAQIAYASISLMHNIFSKIIITTSGIGH